MVVRQADGCLTIRMDKPVPDSPVPIENTQDDVDKPLSLHSHDLNKFLGKSSDVIGLISHPSRMLGDDFDLASQISTELTEKVKSFIRAAFQMDEFRLVSGGFNYHYAYETFSTGTKLFNKSGK